MTTNDKILRIRELMHIENIDAFIIPSGDPHMSEYFSPHWKTRQFVSGFTGSVGTLVITKSMSGLWVDGRYYVQGEKELEGSETILFRASEPECPSFSKYLSENLNDNSTIAFNGKLFSLSSVKSMEKDFKLNNFTLVNTFDFANDIWKDRPEEIYTNVFYLEEKFSGESAKNKIETLRNKISNLNCDSLVLGKLDNISWLFNIRSNDIPCNPVVISYAFISKDKAILFTESSRINEDVKKTLLNNGIEIQNYNEVFNFVSTLNNLNILCDENEINYSLFKKIENNKEITFNLTSNPVALMKACKNSIEIENNYKAYLADGCANAEFYGWLFEALDNNEVITEFDTVKKIQHFRSIQENYFEESFNAIMAYGENAAMMHYSPKENNSSLLKKERLFLNDSGGQYFTGTTDTTRTFALGTPTSQEKHDFTLALKGVIALSSVIFKDGSTGSDLDILCRQFLWNKGMDYRCGTGHGIGFMLNVHETPPNFRERNIKFKPGMLITIEPGVYTEGSHGIRTENTVVVMPHLTTEYGNFFKFETFTLVPIDIDCLDMTLLTSDEINWINSYHQSVYTKVSPLISNRAKEWLSKKTKSI
ncbi:aminopeptidase P family N-terminal domain-containing protein [uncultured Cetobacterium sp.]|uniref:aminopeptidase P family N-terminal domain-containing protein n=1 Tax=uncultured Cetobacterium sp. TaxID=527638 RepID=UPI0026118777|nr:aminopeptidase P family N-terminal domain-containing protein [uncultured Cetobacterium sp.]